MLDFSSAQCLRFHIMYSLYPNLFMCVDFLTFENPTHSSCWLSFLFSCQPEVRSKITYDSILPQDSKSATLWEEELVLVWVPCSSQRSGRSTQIGWCWHSQSSHHQRCLTLWWNLTMLHSLSINWLRMLMSAWSLTTRLSTTSASVPWSLLHPHVSLNILWFVCCVWFPYSRPSNYLYMTSATQWSV